VLLNVFPAPRELDALQHRFLGPEMLDTIRDQLPVSATMTGQAAPAATSVSSLPQFATSSRCSESISAFPVSKISLHGSMAASAALVARIGTTTPAPRLPGGDLAAAAPISA
jgi:hypothetical protein